MLWAENPKQRHEKQETNPPEFKAQMAFEAVKGLKTVQQIAAENEVHPTQVTQWKSQMVKGASVVFEQGRGRHSQEQTAQIRAERLNREIGQLVVEVDWLSKKCKELGTDP